MKHKWHKEIKAWAEGKKIQTRQMFEGKWLDWIKDGSPEWYIDEAREYRIKPSSKKQKYLYIWKPYDQEEDLIVSDRKPKKNDIIDDGIYKLIGKIKLEKT